MKIRTMWTDNSDNNHQSEPLVDKHSETMQDGYMYRLSDIMATYSDEELQKLAMVSKLAYESVERKLFFDEMNPKDVERINALKAEEQKAVEDKKKREETMKSIIDDYLTGKLHKVDVKPVEPPE